MMDGLLNWLMDGLVGELVDGSMVQCRLQGASTAGTTLGASLSENASTIGPGGLGWFVNWLMDGLVGELVDGWVGL